MVLPWQLKLGVGRTTGVVVVEVVVGRVLIGVHDHTLFAPRYGGRSSGFFGVNNGGSISVVSGQRMLVVSDVVVSPIVLQPTAVVHDVVSQ